MKIAVSKLRVFTDLIDLMRSRLLASGFAIFTEASLRPRALLICTVAQIVRVYGVASRRPYLHVTWRSHR